MKIPKIRYYLEAKFKNVKNRIKPELVMAEINYAYNSVDNKGKNRIKPFRYSLRATILPKNFGITENNFRFDEEVFRRFSKSNASIKGIMFQLENKINELTTYYIHNQTTPTPKEFKQELNIKLGRVKRKIEVDISIIDFLKKEIETDKEDINKNKKDGIVKNTIKTYETICNLIENYQLATNDILQFKTFNEEKYWHLWDVLDDIIMDKFKVENPNQTRKQRKQKHGYLTVTVRKYQKLLMATLKQADKKGMKAALNVYDEKLILKNEVASKQFHIHETELKKIIEADVAFDSELQTTKEYFIIGCLTGMRFESMYDTKNCEIFTCNEGIYNFQYIESIQNKTSTKTIIPLLMPVREILRKYGSFPIYKSNTIINKNLKRLFVYLKINRLTEVTKATYRNGSFNEKVSVSDLVSTHDCKRTFYTILSEKNMDEKAIDSITHPKKPKANPMANIYNKKSMISNAKFFVDEIKKIDSVVYKF